MKKWRAIVKFKLFVWPFKRCVFLANVHFFGKLMRGGRKISQWLRVNWTFSACFASLHWRSNCECEHQKSTVTKSESRNGNKDGRAPHELRNRQRQWPLYNVHAALLICCHFDPNRIASRTHVRLKETSVRGVHNWRAHSLSPPSKSREFRQLVKYVKYQSSSIRSSIF